MSSKFINYLDPATALSIRLIHAYEEAGIDRDRRQDVAHFLEVVKMKDVATYKHSIRVGLLTRAIAKFMHLDQKAAMYAGLLHDVGKAQTRPETLKKTSGWTPEDTAEIRSHVMDGYRLLRGKFDFSAEIILWHHRFQPNSYPAEQELPPLLREYCLGTKIMIPLFGRILAIADHFDAVHRRNDKFASEGADDTPFGEVVKRRMFEANKDQSALIEELYKANILTTVVFADPEPEPAAA